MGRSSTDPEGGRGTHPNWPLSVVQDAEGGPIPPATPGRLARGPLEGFGSRALAGDQAARHGGPTAPVMTRAGRKSLFARAKRGSQGVSHGVIRGPYQKQLPTLVVRVGAGQRMATVWQEPARSKIKAPACPVLSSPNDVRLAQEKRPVLRKPGDPLQ